MSDTEFTPRQVAPPTKSMRLMRGNRDSGAVPPPTADPIELHPDTTVPAAADWQAQVAPTVPAVTPPAAAPKPPGPVKVTYYLTAETRDRARAVFKATQDFEDDASYSNMIEKAIVAECARREAEYNAGERFAGGKRQLPAGKQVR